MNKRLETKKFEKKSYIANSWINQVQDYDIRNENTILCEVAK